MSENPPEQPSEEKPPKRILVTGKSYTPGGRILVVKTEKDKKVQEDLVPTPSVKSNIPEK